MKLFPILSLGTLLLVGLTPLSARELAYQTIDGKWHTIDESSWPKPKSDKGKVTIKSGGQITFNVTYLDVVNDTGFGFDDPTHGAARRAVTTEVLTYLNAFLDENGTCDIEFSESETDGTGALGHAGTFYTDAVPITSGFAFEHIVTGSDPSSFVPDITATIDFGWNWFSSTGTNIQNTQVDLYSVLLHELTHGLGITSLISPTGAGEIFPNVYTTYDRLLVTPSNTNLVSAAGVFQVPVNVITGGNGAVLFGGTITSLVYGGPVPIYTPTTYEPGSSVGHFSDTISPAPVMSPALGWGDLSRTFQPFEVAALADLFYTLRSEPVTSVKTWSAYP